MSRNSNESHSGSSTNSSSSRSSSSNQNRTPFSDDLTLYGSAAPTFTRTGTVVRRIVNNNSNNYENKKCRIVSTGSSPEDDELNEQSQKNYEFNRHSFTSAGIERKKSLSMESGHTLNRIFSSVDNISLDSTNYHNLANTISTGYKTDTEKHPESPDSSSYLSWIESVNSAEYYGSASSNAPVQDADQKVGEWNNFWLNYSTARMRHFSTEQTFSSDGYNDGTIDEISDECRKNIDQKNCIEKENSVEYVMLTIDEANEAIKCSQKFTEILQNALKRTDQKENSNSSNDDSLYSQTQPAQQNIPRDSLVTYALNRERSISCAIDPQSLQKQKHLLKSNQHQSSSTGCINAILNSGVADMLKKVISKRRDVIGSEIDNRSVTTRSSFSEWSSK